MDSKIHEKLLEPFEDADIEWRLQWVNEDNTKGKAVPYVTNRAIQYRLDETVGCDNWKNEFIPWHSDGKKASQLCGISIYDKERNGWITKYDGAEDTDIEPIKGGLSDSMKRAAVQWGIGRYLYGMDTEYVNVEKPGRTPIISKKDFPKLNAAHQAHVARITGKLNDTGSPTPKQEPRPAPKPEVNQPQSQKPTVGPRELPKPTPAEQAKTQKANDATIWVVGVAEMQTLNGKATTVQLQDAYGRKIDAFVKGTDPALVVGAMLRKTEFSHKENQGVAFHILEKYEVMEQAAA